MRLAVIMTVRGLLKYGTHYNATWQSMQPGLILRADSSFLRSRSFVVLLLRMTGKDSHLLADRTMRGLTRGLTVHKFGGASLADARAMRNAVTLAGREAGSAAIVVSALAGVTDALIEAAGAVGKNAGRIEEIAANLAQRHRRSILGVVPAGPVRQELLATVNRAFEELALLSRAPVFVRDLSPGALDALLSRGEEMSARIFAAGLAAAGRPALFVNPLDVIATDGRFGGASPRLHETDRKVRRILAPILKKGVVPVVAGFYGAAPDGRVVTLGRGGSDLTATLLARALPARAVFLWKDVPGILTAD